MVGSKLKYYYLLILLMVGFSSTAQKHLFSEVSARKSSVYVGEPVEVSITIYTSTWFTSGVRPGNIKVKDAFTIFFKSASLSKQINGKTYAAVQLIYNVFPYNDNDIVFPSLEFEVETPDSGGFKAVTRTVKTSSRNVKVKPIPAAFNKNEWLVTNNMTVTENWSGNRNEVKVGDVLERKITRNVANTVAELIPPIIWDSIPNVSLYPTRSNVKSNKTKTTISATRSDGINYLFEKEGEVVIPEKVLTWYNPRTKKLLKRTLKSVTIKVLPNPNLGMLESVRDSLQVSKPVESAGIEEEEAENTILGLTIKEFITALLILIVGGYLLFKIIKIVVKIRKEKRKAYLNSEKYFFDEFIKSINKGEVKNVVNHLYSWISQLNLIEPTASFFILKYGSKELIEDFKKVNESASSIENIQFNKKHWIQSRKNFIDMNAIDKPEISEDWVNP